MRSGILSALAALAGSAIVFAVSAAPRDTGGLTSLMRAQLAARSAHPHDAPRAPQHATECIDGMADIYPCSNIDLLAFVPKSEFGSGLTNSLWGWVDPDNGDEYALIGADDGVVFYRLTPDPTHPVYVGKLLTYADDSLWRDVRVYQKYAYVGSDNNPGHGLQVFDLTRLRGLTTPQDFPKEGDGHYSGFGSSHTLSVNTETGYLGVAGGDHFCPGDSEAGGLQLLDIHTDPTQPTLAACVNTDGYTHEAQCFVYHGPDTAYDDHEICFNSDGWSGHLAIVDANDKNALQSLSIIPYTGSAFTHQGWLTDDHRYFLVNDELDEEDHGHNARTYVFDVSDLHAPALVGYHQHPLSVIDHNLYVHGQYVFESNYEAGLRILRIDNLSAAEMTEVAFFDLYPNSDTKNFNGNWNNFLFPSGMVIATSIDEGFFVLEPHICTAPVTPAGLTAVPNGDNRIDLAWSAGADGTTYRVERAQGSCSGTFRTIADQLADAVYPDTSASGQVTYGYRVIAVDETGFCASEASECVEAETTGECTAAPLFAGIQSAENAGTSQCHVDLAWNAASPACGSATTYSVYRSEDPDFIPGDDTRILSDWFDTMFADLSASGRTTYYYVVRAVDGVNHAEDDNLVRLAATPSGPLADGTFATGAEPGDPLLDTSGTAGAGGVRIPDEVEHAGWHISSELFHAGAQSFWSIAANNLCITLTTPPLDLTAGESSTLSFWSAWDIEQGWDGGVIEISTDGGTNWSRVTPVGGYPGTITNGGTLCGVAQGDGAFTGMNHLDWTSYDVDLSAHAGETVQLRWLYRTDQAQTGEGWFVDDIALTHAQVPGMCMSAADAIFIDGFDNP